MRSVPISGAHVEIWHADASGDYSSYDDNGDGKDEGAGTTFLRGFQTTNADGIADFITIYPGWYQRRAVHIHIRVAVGGANVLTAQLYFDEEYTEQVFATGPYAEFGLPDTSWSRDRIVGDPTKDGTGIMLAAADTELGPGTLGLANIGVSSNRLGASEPGIREVGTQNASGWTFICRPCLSDSCKLVV